MKKLTLETIQQKLATYQYIVMMSFIFGVLGFVYNNWRYEHNENNNNIRVASFQMIQELASLEQNVYANHYDNDMHKGSPRDGWVKVGLINDLALFIDPTCKINSDNLKKTWTKEWSHIHTSKKSADSVVKEIEKVKTCTRSVLKELY